MTYKVLFVKILPTNRVDAMLDGNIFMNTDKYFSILDSGDLARSDPDEDVDEAWQIKQISIADSNGNWVPIGGVINPVLHRYGARDHLNIFCMHAIRNTSDYCFHETNLAFGDVAVVIRNAKEFTERFRKAAHLLERNVQHGPVTYVNRSNYHGEIGPFRKFDRYEYQNEFRFVLFGGGGNPMSLPIGDIRDISFVIPASDIPKLHPKYKGQ